MMSFSRVGFLIPVFGLLAWIPWGAPCSHGQPADSGHNTLTEADRAAGWQLLFDGRTTTGWRGFKQRTFPKQGWVVEDGCLKHQRGGGGGDIVTEAQFEGFEFEFEWKVSPRSNSGVKYFVIEGRAQALGHEYQVIDDAAQGYALAGDKHRTASFYDVLPLTVPVEPKPIGQFNRSRIVVRGQAVEHWLNGVKVLGYELSSPAVQAAVARSKFKDVAGFGTRVRGHLLLQDHGGEVWFRNLRIRELE